MLTENASVALPYKILTNMAKSNTLRLMVPIILYVLIGACTNQKQSKMIVEITTYKAANNVTHEALLLASEAFNKNYCAKCKGLVSRQFLKTDEGYMDIFVWKSKADVENVQQTFMQDANAMKFANLTDTNSLTMKNYEVLETSYFNN